MPEYALGIDVGYSQSRSSTGLCLLTLDEPCIRWDFCNTCTRDSHRRVDLQSLVPCGTTLLGVGVDGPLASGLRTVLHYRSADAILSRGTFQSRGKPGQTSSPVGQCLHRHAIRLSTLVIDLQDQGHLALCPAGHPDPIHDSRIVEAFPTCFLPVLLSDKEVSGFGSDSVKSDEFWEIATCNGYLQNVIQDLVPQATTAKSLDSITNHDERAAFVCALTVLCVARNRYVAAGDPRDGYIILPPADLWGAGPGQKPWAETALRKNLESVRRDRRTHPNFGSAWVIRDGNPWMI